MKADGGNRVIVSTLNTVVSDASLHQRQQIFVSQNNVI